MDMKPVDTLACFPDYQKSNNVVNNKAIEKNQKSIVNYIAYTITQKCLNDSMPILKILLMYRPGLRFTSRINSAVICAPAFV